MVTSDKIMVADSLNSYITTIANTLVSKLPCQSECYGESCPAVLLTTGVSVDAFSFEEVSVNGAKEAERN
jgi:hypothetical protein